MAGMSKLLWVARFVLSYGRDSLQCSWSSQSDPYVRVLINDVVEARTEVINNGRSNLLLEGFNILIRLLRPEPLLGPDHLRPW